MKKTRICQLLGIEYPVIQAPMNWITGVELASAVSNAGGLGTLGPNAGYRTVTRDVTETGRRLREQIKKLKTMTKKPFAVNFAARAGAEFQEMMMFSEEYVKVAIEEGIPVALTSGNDPEVYTGRFKNAGIKVLHRPIPCTVENAKKAESAGVDAVIVVGFESGGHSGVYRIPTLVLVPQVVDAVKIPVIAGGGIADGRGLAAALALGAQGAFIGTAFITTFECPAHQNYKQAIIDAGDIGTVTWTTANGSTRALRNPASEKCVKMQAEGVPMAEVTAIARSTYMQGILEGDVVNSVLVCGAAAGLIKKVTGAAEFTKNLIKEADQALSRLK